MALIKIFQYGEGLFSLKRIKKKNKIKSISAKRKTSAKRIHASIRRGESLEKFLTGNLRSL